MFFGRSRHRAAPASAAPTPLDDLGPWVVERSLPGHTEQINSVATALVDGRPIAVTSGRDRAARVSTIDHAELLGELPVGRFTAVALSALDGVPVVLTAGDYSPEFAWDPASGRCVRALPVDDAVAVAATILDGRPVAVTGHDDTTVRLWDLTDGRQLGRPLDGHTQAVHAVVVAVVAGRPVAATSSGMDVDQSWDEDVRLWDLTTGTPIGTFRAATTSAVDAVAVADLDGRPVVATADWAGTVRLWDPSAGLPPERTILGSHADGAWALATMTLDGRPVLASGADDGTLCLWDPVGRRQSGPVLRFPHPVRAVTAAAGGRLVVCSGPEAAVLARRPDPAERAVR